MRQVAKLDAQVMSLSGSDQEPSLFASLMEDGHFSVWDVRSNGRVLTTPKPSQHFSSDSGNEILFLDSRNVIVSLCGGRIQFTDTRRSDGPLSQYFHSKDLACFNSVGVAAEDQHILVADEDGGILSISLQTYEPTGCIDYSVFGKECQLNTVGFGYLENYCCGLGPVQSPEGFQGLLSLGMNGSGFVYEDPFSAQPFELELDFESAPFVVNPPLPTCCAFDVQQVAVGKANGVYDVLSIGEHFEVESVLSSPGHSSNGIVYLDWSPMGLLTVSLCGEITAWDVSHFLDEDPETQEPGALPAVTAALSHRGDTGLPHAVVNSCTPLGGSTQYVLADTLGCIAVFDLVS